jgi:Rad3-related DNA helicase
MDTKGIVHVSYSIANDLKKYLENEEWALFHDKENKEDVLKFFKEGADKGYVLIAAGMNTGIDFKGPDFGWQAIGKIIYPSMGDAVLKHWYKTDNSWITWLATRELIQACGRVNRDAEDKAVTYIWDSCFGNPYKRRHGLFTNADKQGYITDNFKKRIDWGK